MRRDRDVRDATPIVCEQHQHEQEAVGHRRNHEEIGRHDLADVIPQKRGPGLRGRLTAAHHVFRNGRLTEIDPEFQPFAMNPGRAPPRVCLRHRANQRPDVRRQGIGTLLLDEVKRHSPHGVSLYVFQQNTDARAFYERHGFTVFDTSDGDRNMENLPDMTLRWTPDN